VALQDTDRQLLVELVELSHIYGSPDYVQAGGGNTSVKTDRVLYVKPSGVPLAAVTMDQLVAIDRAMLSKIYAMQQDLPAAEGQAQVGRLIAEAVISSGKGRPSVETPLHDSLQWRFVVHTHPALVNGMTCSIDGKVICARLFQDALWMDYVDPGLALCTGLRISVEGYQRIHGRQPSVIFLQNHGLVVGGQTPSQVHQIHAKVIDTLVSFYRAAGLSIRIDRQRPSQDVASSAAQMIRKAFGSDVAVEVAAGFACPQGPLTPDHIVYARSYPLASAPTPQAVLAYRRSFGFDPRIVTWDGLVCGVGKDQIQARAALDLAADGALVSQLAAAFGGVRYMTDQARRFIEGWEAEAYRLKVLQSSPDKGGC